MMLFCGVFWGLVEAVGGLYSANLRKLSIWAIAFP